MGTLRSKTAVKRRHESHRPSNPIEISFLLQDWEDAYNVGGLYRVADGCGAKELIMTGRTPVMPNPMIAVTSLGAHRRIPSRHFAKHDEAAKQLVEEGWTLIAVEITDDAVPYSEFAYPRKCCLVLGSEGAGVYSSVMKQCSGSVYIPMLGKGRSLNVHVAAAIVAFEAVLKSTAEADLSQTGLASNQSS